MARLNKPLNFIDQKPQNHKKTQTHGNDKMRDIEEFLNQLTLPPSTSEAPSVYAFSLHKSGSTLLFNMLSDLAPHAGLTYFSMQDQMFINGIMPNSEIPNSKLFFKPKGYLYGGFRFFPQAYKLENLNNHKKILLIRNPMDALVSMYFSRKKSHAIPKKGLLREVWLKRRESADAQDIEAFVKEKYKSHIKRIKSYKEILSQDNCVIYRYEDIIYDKLSFLKNICQQYGWVIEEKILTKIVNKYDVFPETEKEESHVRQVHPGNYKKKLSAETQQFLELEFQDILEAFGYSVNPTSAFSRLSA
jgi:hypothetical protein